MQLFPSNFSIFFYFLSICFHILPVTYEILFCEYSIYNRERERVRIQFVKWQMCVYSCWFSNRFLLQFDLTVKLIWDVTLVACAAILRPVVTVLCLEPSLILVYQLLVTLCRLSACWLALVEYCWKVELIMNCDGAHLDHKVLCKWSLTKSSGEKFAEAWCFF